MLSLCTILSFWEILHFDKLASVLCNREPHIAQADCVLLSGVSGNAIRHSGSLGIGICSKRVSKPACSRKTRMSGA